MYIKSEKKRRNNVTQIFLPTKTPGHTWRQSSQCCWGRTSGSTLWTIHGENSVPETIYMKFNGFEFMSYWKDLDRHHIKGTDESTLGKDWLIHLMYHDLSDLGWSILILIVPMTIEHTIFGVLHSVLKREHVVKTCPAQQFPCLHRYVLVDQCMCQFISD